MFVIVPMMIGKLKSGCQSRKERGIFHFGWLAFRLSNEVPQKARDKLWTLLQIGLGSYPDFVSLIGTGVVGRTGEKIVEKIRK